MSGHTFTFDSSYEIAACPSRVLGELVDVEQWSAWWPQIHAVERYDDRRGVMTIRSVLPLTLRVAITERARRVEATDGDLAADLSGDLTGWVRFEVRSVGDSAFVRFSQQARLTKAGVSVLAGPAALLLRANHALMMRSGIRGLRTRCADSADGAPA